MVECIHAGLRNQCRKDWGFKSLRGQILRRECPSSPTGRGEGLKNLKVKVQILSGAVGLDGGIGIHAGFKTQSVRVKVRVFLKAVRAYSSIG